MLKTSYLTIKYSVENISSIFKNMNDAVIVYLKKHLT